MENIEIEEKIKKVNKKLKLNIIIFVVQIVLIVAISSENILDIGGGCPTVDFGDIETISAIHNQAFEAYEGKQKGTTLKNLIAEIRSNNETYPELMITIVFSSSTEKKSVEKIKEFRDGEDPNGEYHYEIKANVTYFVTFIENKDGFIDTCEIHVYSNADLNNAK